MVSFFEQKTLEEAESNISTSNSITSPVNDIQTINQSQLSRTPLKFTYQHERLNSKFADNSASKKLFPSIYSTPVRQSPSPYFTTSSGRRIPLYGNSASKYRFLFCVFCLILYF